jgi:hypothetical protein
MDKTNNIAEKDEKQNIRWVRVLVYIGLGLLLIGLIHFVVSGYYPAAVRVDQVAVRVDQAAPTLVQMGGRVAKKAVVTHATNGYQELLDSYLSIYNV